MKETLLLYNITDKKMATSLKFLCVRSGIRIKDIEPAQYDIPLGLLAFGKREEQDVYLRESAGTSFPEPMLVFAGFTGKRLDVFLSAMRKEKVPPISLKAMLTEHNAVWDSVTLHDEIKKEHEMMHR